jgi:hypothetical protein
MVLILDRLHSRIISLKDPNLDVGERLISILEEKERKVVIISLILKLQMVTDK